MFLAERVGIGEVIRRLSVNKLICYRSRKAVLSMRAPRASASDLNVWTVIGGPAFDYGVDQEDRQRLNGNSLEGVVVQRRAKAGGWVFFTDA